MEWTRSDNGFTETKDGRFRLEPSFNHGTRPYCYTLYDRGVMVPKYVATQTRGKAIAADIINNEQTKGRNDNA